MQADAKANIRLNQSAIEENLLPQSIKTDGRSGQERLFFYAEKLELPLTSGEFPENLIFFIFKFSWQKVFSLVSARLENF